MPERDPKEWKVMAKQDDEIVCIQEDTMDHPMDERFDLMVKILDKPCCTDLFKIEVTSIHDDDEENC